jgi:hypothetical protein
MKDSIFNLVTNGDKINNKNFNLDIYNESKRNCLTCCKGDIKTKSESTVTVFCYGDRKPLSYKLVNTKINNDCEFYQSYNSLSNSEDKRFTDIYNKIFSKPNFIEDKELLKIVKPETGETIAHIQAQNGWMTNDLEILQLKDNNGWTVAHELSMRGHKITDKKILQLVDKKETTVAEVQALHNNFTDDLTILKLPARNHMMLIAHVQAYRGWSTTDETVLQLKDAKDRTVNNIIVSKILMEAVFLIKEEEIKND